jgi:hypothetical protein
VPPSSGAGTATRTAAVCLAATGITSVLGAAPAVAGPVPSDVGARAVALAAKEAGDRYEYGAEGPDAFDCSGLVQYVYAQLGVALPRTSRAQFAATTPVPKDQARPGDIVFFADASGRIYHDGIYAGGGTMWAAPYTGQSVRLQKVHGTSWSIGRPSTSSSGALKEGARGPAVTEVQRALGLGADGVFGRQTAAAVARFQSSRGLTVDGVVGPATLRALRSGGSAPVSARPAPPHAVHTGRPTLREGRRGADVAVLQSALRISADGAFGPRTRAAVVAHQRRAGLTPDGVVGARTWASL